jgi:hypothetical protein
MSDDFIPAPLATSDDFIPAPLASDNAPDFIESSSTPEQTVTEALSKADSYSAAVQAAKTYADSPVLRPLFVKALADRQKAHDLRSPEEKATSAVSVLSKIPAAAGKTLWSIITDTLPAVASNVSDLVAGNPVDRVRALGEAVSAVQGAAVNAHELLRKAGENLSDTFVFGKPGLSIVSDPVGQLISSPPQSVQSDEEYASRADKDILGAQTTDEAAKGALVPSIQAVAENSGSPIRPERSQALQVAYDPQNWLPLGAGFIVGKVGSSLGLGIRTAEGVEIVAKGLQTMAEATQAANTAGVLRKGLGGLAAGAGNLAIKASDNPSVTGAIAGAAALAAGAEPSTAILASLLGASSKKLTGPVATALERSGQTLVKVGDQIAGKASLGPMGRFAESAVNFVKPAVTEGAAQGVAISAPFALSSRDEQDVADTLGGTAAFGIGGHLVGQVSGAANRYFSIDNAFRDTTAKKPDSAYERPDYTPYSSDAGHPLEVESKRVYDTLSNKGAQTVEAIKKIFSKPGEDGLKTEIYLLGKETADAVAKKYAGEETAKAGFSVPVPEEGRRIVVINADSNGGISLGHEVGHAFFESLPQVQKKALLDAVSNAVDARDFVDIRNRYEDLFNRKQTQDGSFVSVPEAERKSLSPVDTAKEYLAENFSAYLNGIPIEKFGSPRGLADRIRISVGSALEKAGARRLTADDSAGVKTPLGYKPSAALAELYQNFIEARKLDEATIPGEKPKEITLPPASIKTEETFRAASTEIANARPVEPKKALPGFKKGDPIGEIRNDAGTIVGEDAKVVRAIDSPEGKTYEVEFTHPDTGERLIGTVPESFLRSNITPGAVNPEKLVFHKSPVTPETPFGSVPQGEGTNAAIPTEKTTGSVKPVAAPVAPPKTTNLRPGAAEKFAAKATDEIHLQNRKVLEKLFESPRHEIPAVETDYYSAKSPVDSPDAVVRQQQRDAADAAEKAGVVNPFREQMAKVFVPYRFSPYKLSAETNQRLYPGQERQPGGVYGMSVDKIGQNLDLLQGLALENPKIAKTLAASGFDKSYLGSDTIVSDFRSYLENQSHGYGGGGEKLNLPADTTPGSVTARDPSFVPNKLSLEKRQLFNLLLNIEQQKSRSVGMEYSDRFARLNGLDPLTVGFDKKGRPLTERNALRAALLKDGFNPDILNSAVENLPTENLTTPLKERKDLSLPAADVGITQAGFMPEGQPADRESKVARIKELNARAKVLYDKGGLTRQEGEKYNSLLKEVNSIRFDIAKPLPIEKIPSKEERQSTLDAQTVLTARNDLMSSKPIFEAITDAAAGSFYNSDTPVDNILNGKNPEVTLSQFVDAFQDTRDAMKEQYGDTIKLYRATTDQKAKASENWATTEAFAKNFGDKIVSKTVPIDDILAVNVGPFGKYHEIILKGPGANKAGFTPETQRASENDFSPSKVRDVLNKRGWAILTSENPDAKQLSPKENAIRLEALKKDLDAEGIKHRPTEGHYGQPENSVLALGDALTYDKAVELANKYSQDSVLTPDGLVYRDGSVLPAKSVQTFDTKPDDNYTKIKDSYFSVSFSREFGDALPANSSEVLALKNKDTPSADFMPDTPAFKKWFGDSKVVDREDGAPLRVFHGTTHDFTKFDRTKANVENDWGKGFYFSNTPEEVGLNYSREGPDLTSRLEQRADRLENDGLSREEAIAKAREELNGGRQMTVPAYLSLKKPIEIGGETPTYFDSEYKEKDGDVQLTGKIIKFIDAVRNVAWEFDNVGDLGQFSENLLEKFEGGAKAGDIITAAKGDESLLYATDIEGNSAPTEILRRAIEKMGYDGIIDHTVNRKFGSERDLGKSMGGMDENTVHYIAFKPTQIKSATGNSGTFSARNPDIRFMPEQLKKASDEFDKGGLVTLYHGTSNSEALLNGGFSSEGTKTGANKGKKGNLYLSSSPEDARWFADNAGGGDVLSVRVPADSLRVDPEDGIGNNVSDEFKRTLAIGTPAKFATSDPLTPASFSRTNFMPEQLKGKRLPDAIEDKSLLLVHRGTGGLSEIDPAKFGKSGITSRSELAGAPRSYFYVKGLENKGDMVMNRSASYEVPVSGNRIYDADNDALGWSQQINRWKADDKLKDAGYAGISRTRGTGKSKFQQVELFESVKTIIPKQELKNERIKPSKR